MKEGCFVWCFVSIWVFCFCFSFERLLGSFGSGCGPRAMEYILLFNGKSWFCTLVEMEKKSCGFQCEPLLWFSFPYSYRLVYGRKKTHACPPSLKITLFLQTTSQVLAMRINLPCVRWVSCQLYSVSVPMKRCSSWGGMSKDHPPCVGSLVVLSAWPAVPEPSGP